MFIVLVHVGAQNWVRTHLVGTQHRWKPVNFLLLLHVQVQEENLQQAQLMAKQAEQIEAVNKDLQDTQKLLAALQSKCCTALNNCI